MQDDRQDSFYLHSLPCRYHLHGTSSLILGISFAPAGPLLFVFSRPPPSLSLLSCLSSCTLPPYVLLIVYRPSLCLPPAPLPPPPPSRGLLRPPAPPLAPPPPVLSTHIARKDEDVGNRTGGVETCWSDAGGSTPHGKCPNSPLVVVGDSISRPLFLHRPQQ